MSLERAYKACGRCYAVNGDLEKSEDLDKF